jgi:hypothetical protein
MRRCGWVFVLVLFSGCANNRPGWPASVPSFSSFTDDQKTSVLKSLNQFNQDIGEVVVSLTSTDGFPVYYQFTPTDDSNNTMAGLTTLTSDKCTTQLFSKLFEPANAGYVDLVVRHELGHCTGLGHVATHGEIMFAVAAPFSTFTTAADDRFYSDFLAKAGLK